MNMKEKYENLVVEVMSVETEKGYCASPVTETKSVGARNMHFVGTSTDFNGTSSDYSY